MSSPFTIATHLGHLLVEVREHGHRVHREHARLEGVEAVDDPTGQRREAAEAVEDAERVRRHRRQGVTAARGAKGPAIVLVWLLLGRLRGQRDRQLRERTKAVS